MKHEMRIYVKFYIEEYLALHEMAEEDLREEAEELRYLIREEANRRGITIQLKDRLKEE